MRVSTNGAEARPARVAVLDLGTNSTRMLVAEVADGRINELARGSEVTRLGRGLDLSGQLSGDAIEEVCAAVGAFIAEYESHDPDEVVAVATSAVRDAANGSAFIAELRERFAIAPRVLAGDEEARLTYLGATAWRDGAASTLVCDIGGGSTELTLGRGGETVAHSSLQVGVVRHSERHLASDPPTPAELEELADDVRGSIRAGLAQGVLAAAEEGVAVAGTPTSLAAINLELDPYDPERVHGHRMTMEKIQRCCSELSGKTVAQRREVTGLHPGRAPTIVAGIVILIQVMRAFGLEEIEVSERDLLHGAALEAARARA